MDQDIAHANDAVQFRYALRPNWIQAPELGERFADHFMLPLDR